VLICVKAATKAAEFSLVALKKVSAFAPSRLDLNQGSQCYFNHT
jgi:hypothetical protein